MKKRSKKIALYSLTPALAAFLMVGMASAETTTTPAGIFQKGRIGMGAKSIGHKDGAALASALGITEAELSASLKSGKTIDQLITEKGLSKSTVLQTLKAAHEAQVKADLAAKVASGKITQAQADQKIADKAARELKHREALASALGISVAALDVEIQSGKTMDQLAVAHGLTTAQLKAKLELARVAQLKADLAVRVASGKITQAQADKILAHTEAKHGENKGHELHKRQNERNEDRNES